MAVLVNDEPITNHEVDQRARLMSVGSISKDQVQTNFKALIKRKSTNQRLRAILQETIEANQRPARAMRLWPNSRSASGIMPRRCSVRP